MPAGGKLSTKSHWKRCLTWTRKLNDIRQCTVCGCQWMPIKGIDKRDHSILKTCSNQCVTQRKSDSLKLKAKNNPELWSINARKGGQKSAQCRVLRSKDEKQLFEYCKEKFTSVKHNVILVDGWDADIYIEEENLAILWNGPWHYIQMPFKNHSLKQVQNRDKLKQEAFKLAGINTLVFNDAECTPKQAFDYINTYSGFDRSGSCPVS